MPSLRQNRLKNVAVGMNASRSAQLVMVFTFPLSRSAAVIQSVLGRGWSNVVVTPSVLSELSTRNVEVTWSVPSDLSTQNVEVTGSVPGNER
jgi:hypothetical protein